MKARPGLVLTLFSSVAALMEGCGGQSAPPISVNISPSVVTSLDQGQTAAFSANVTNDTPATGVAWSVRGSGCAGAACGTIANQTALSATYLAPSAVSANLTVKIVATASSDHTKSASASITVVPPPAITTKSLPGATAGESYTQTLQATGGVAPYNWGLAAGVLTPGLLLNADGSISGSPVAAGTFNFTAQVTDSGNPSLTALASLSITVTVLPLSVSTTSLPDGTVDIAYKQPVHATGGIPPYVWSITSGALPSWATENPSTGTISGIPGAAGSATFTVQVADSESASMTAQQALTISVAAGSAAKNSALNGHYAFLFNGMDDMTGLEVATAGSFTADGKGNITAGIADENGPGGPRLASPFTGTYNIGSDNRGAFTISTANESRTYALVLRTLNNGVAEKGRFVEFDDVSGSNGRRGSGVLQLQDTTSFAQAKITGSYAFGFAGQDAAGNREAMVGSFSADGAGSLPTGIADENVVGTGSNPSLSGSYTAPSSSNGRAVLSLHRSNASSMDLSVYLLSANELLAITTNPSSSDGLLSGTLQSQSLTSFDNSSLDAPSVYYQLGVDPSASTTRSFAELGLLSANGSGALTANYDKRLGGTLVQDQTFTANYSVASGGRVTINGWYGDSTNPTRILYLVDKNKAFFLEASAAVGFGFVEPQSPPPAGGFSNTSFSGSFSSATGFPAVSLNPNGCGLVTLDASGNFNQVADVSATSGVTVDQQTRGVYSIASNGRGTVTSLVIVSAGFAGPIAGVFLAFAVLLSRRRSRRTTPRPAFALFCCTILFATTPAACPRLLQNRLVFYMISPAKAVMFHQASLDTVPALTFVEE